MKTFYISKAIGNIYSNFFNNIKGYHKNIYSNFFNNIKGYHKLCYFDGTIVFKKDNIRHKENGFALKINNKLYYYLNDKEYDNIPSDEYWIRFCKLQVFA